MQGQNDLGVVTFHASCRGSGNVYVRIGCTREGVARWEAHALTAEGIEVPSCVVEDESGRPVLACAILKCRQRITVDAYDEDGTLLARGTHTVSHGVEKITSVVSGRVEAEEARLMRSLGRMEGRSGIRLTPMRSILVAAKDSLNLLQFLIEVPARTREEAMAPLKLVTFSLDGKPFAADQVQTIGDHLLRHPEVGSAFLRQLQVSVTLSVLEYGVCVWLQCDDGRPGVFFTMLPNEMRDLLITAQSEQVPVEVVSNYERWMLSERADEGALALQREASARFAIQPVFSIIIPLYHTPVNFLVEAVDSMLEQSYPHIELILVNSTPEDEDLSACVARYADKDPRVKVVNLEANLGITENTNAGIAVATGDFLSFMDHDDVAERELFYRYVEGINAYPETDMLYCDEDLLIDGHYTNPFLKPDWSRLFEETNNYCCHLLTVRRSIVSELDVPTAELDGAQDHSLTLAVSERARNVYHVRRVLYHWRSHPLSTSQNPDAKPESLMAGKLGIDRHFRRLGIPANVQPRMDWLHVYQVDIPLLRRPTATVVCWGEGRPDPALLAACQDAFREPALVEVERVGDEDWSQAVARALEDAAGELVMVVRRDVRCTQQGWLRGLTGYVLRPDLGLVGPRLLHADRSIASLGLACSGVMGICDVGRLLPQDTNLGRGYSQLAHDVTGVAPQCLLVNRELLERVGGWDGSLSMRAAALDLGVRVRKAGMLVGTICTSEVTVEADPVRSRHRQDAASIKEARDLATLVCRWPQLAGPDRFYNGALSHDGRFGFEGGWQWLIPMGTFEKLRFKLSY